MWRPCRFSCCALASDDCLLPIMLVQCLFSAIKVKVYSLVSRSNCQSLDFTQSPPGNRTCSFISHLNSPRSIQPGCHFQLTELFKHTSLRCPTRYPLTCHGSRECACRQSDLSRSTTSEHNSAQPGIEPAISRLYVAHATIEPRRPTRNKIRCATFFRLTVCHYIIQTKGMLSLYQLLSGTEPETFSLQ